MSGETQYLIHTLVGACLQTLHDHIDEKTACDEKLIFHYYAIWIKDEFRKQWADRVRDARNFFKHAENDLKIGRTEIEFETDTTEFYIFEAIRCLHIIEGATFDFSPEFRVFCAWYGLKYPTHFKEDAADTLREAMSHVPGSPVDPDDYELFRNGIALLTSGQLPPLIGSAKPAKTHYRGGVTLPKFR